MATIDTKTISVPINFPRPDVNYSIIIDYIYDD